MCELIVDICNIIVGIVGIVVAVVAVIIAKKTCNVQNEYNKNSVRPILNIADCDYENTLYIQLDNKGVGPAIITDIKFISSYYEMDIVSNNIVELLPVTAIISNQDIQKYVNLDICFDTFVEDITGRTIAQQEQMLLLKITFDDEVEDKALVHLAIRNYLSNCSVSIEYINVYGDKMDVYNHDFSFFGRLVDYPEDIEYSEKRIPLY